MSSSSPTHDLEALAVELADSARAAGLKLGATPAEKRTRAILALAKRLRESQAELLSANARDLQTAASTGLAPAMQKRLALDEKKIDAMARAVEDIANQTDPVGQILDSHRRTDGLLIEKVRVPVGSVLFVYESRPNVTTDAAALCLRSGNAVILRGGKEAIECNRVLSRVIEQALRDADLDPKTVQVVEVIDRALLPLLLKQDRSIDVVIPRGGHSLIRVVVDEARMPVLKHFDGNCHLYIDAHPPAIDEVVNVVVNAKTSYPGGAVCNAVEHVLVHRASVALIEPITAALRKLDVEVRGCETTIQHAGAVASQIVPAVESDWAAEYLAFIVGIKVVDSLTDAIAHINRFGSHHTDGILSTDEQAIDAFVKQVDSASVMVNASTRLADGGEFGLGAEIGISTDKLHARGPMGAADLCTYKWIVRGNGHLRG
jgi:glutamate-5-semialdehyde dehydrogenase